MNSIPLSLQETVHSASPAAKCGHSEERERLDVECVLEATGSQVWLFSYMGVGFSLIEAAHFICT